jgi:hypothetical protein
LANYYPARRGPAATPLQRRTARAYARAEERIALELYGLDREEVIGHAKLHVLGSLGHHAVHKALDLGWEVQANIPSNPIGAELAMGVARQTTREMSQVIERTSWRLG